jgi:hypothetical protein
VQVVLEQVVLERPLLEHLLLERLPLEHLRPARRACRLVSQPAPVARPAAVLRA